MIFVEDKTSAPTTIVPQAQAVPYCMFKEKISRNMYYLCIIIFVEDKTSAPTTIVPQAQALPYCMFKEKIFA